MREILFGAISGALDPDSKEAQEHAERYYDLVRHMKTDVLRIAQNTGYSAQTISKIRQFIFLEKHDWETARLSALPSAMKWRNHGRG